MISVPSALALREIAQRLAYLDAEQAGRRTTQGCVAYAMMHWPKYSEDALLWWAVIGTGAPPPPPSRRAGA